MCPHAWADLSSFQLLTGFAARIKPVMWVHGQPHSAEEKAGGQGRCPCPSYPIEGCPCPQSVQVPCSGRLGAQLHHLLWASASPWDMGVLKLAVLSGPWMVGESGWYSLQPPHLEQLLREPEPGGIRAQWAGAGAQPGPSLGAGAAPETESHVSRAAGTSSCRSGRASPTTPA